jgi:5-methyltetrahydropteroyltriglutamate--homocysteine methyltransferase
MATIVLHHQMDAICMNTVAQQTLTIPEGIQPLVTLPSRFDHVGSFLRPPALLAARRQHAEGAIDAAQLQLAENAAIREIVKFQEDVGLKAITDGEYRRTCFHIDFLDQLQGVHTTQPTITATANGESKLAPPVIRVMGKVEHGHAIELENFQFLQSIVSAGSTPKVAIPSPTMLHFRGGREGISHDAYPTLDPDFYEDVATAYGDELRALAAAGCRYVQLDDTNLAYLCDAKMRAEAQQRGDDPVELAHRYAQFINRVVAHKPAGMLMAIHLCRGNFKSSFAASGDYEPVAEALLAEMQMDAYFLEYDDERSGDFRPLRYLPKGKTAVLGLISTKSGALESKDTIKRRIEEAAKFAPLEQLALSPQCGFASSVEGNNISWDDQRRKLELVATVVHEVWGS